MFEKVILNVFLLSPLPFLCSAPAPPIPGPPCINWTHTVDSYYEACGGSNGDIGTFSGLTPAQAEAACCANLACAGFSFSRSDGSGYYKVRLFRFNVRYRFFAHSSSTFYLFCFPSSVGKRSMRSSPIAGLRWIHQALSSTIEQWYRDGYHDRVRGCQHVWHNLRLRYLGPGYSWIIYGLLHGKVCATPWYCFPSAVAGLRSVC